MVRLFIFLLLFCTVKISAEKNDKKPNFLFILVDDQPHDAVGFSERYPFLKTPNSPSNVLVPSGAIINEVPFLIASST